MGIYDREYVRVGPRSRSGLGSLRFISVNSWLIIINVAVFLLGVMVFARPVPVTVGQVYNTNAQNAILETSRTVRQQPRLLTSTRSPTTYAFPIVAQARNPDGTPAFDRTGSPLYIHVGDELFIQMPLLHGWGHFSTLRGFFGLEMWRFITFQFLHGNFWHLFFNMFGLWVFGGMVEQYLGSKRYLAFYLTCGIFGAIAYLILNFMGAVLRLNLPGVLINETWTPLIGASAGVFGVILAAAYIAPEAILQLIFPPIPIKLKWFAYGYVAIAAWNLLMGGHNAGGDAAHVGGAIAGYFFIRNAHLLRDFFDFFGERKPPPAPTDGAEVDRILAKVKAMGLDSLTPGERRVLHRATVQRRRA